MTETRGITFRKLSVRCKHRYYRNYVQRCGDSGYKLATIDVECCAFNCPVWRGLKEKE